MFANVAKAEGHPFTIYTPADGVRLVSERNDDDFVELWLDASLESAAGGDARQPASAAATCCRREGLLRAGAPIPSLTDEDVLAFLLGEGRGEPGPNGRGLRYASRSTNDVSTPSRRSTARKAWRSKALR